MDQSEDDEIRKESKDQSRAMAVSPRHVHSNEWKDMVGMSDFLTPPQPAYDHRFFESKRIRSITRPSAWIEQALQKRECTHFIATHKHTNKCGCGRTTDRHFFRVAPVLASKETLSASPSSSRHRWSIRKHSSPLPTDAYGTIQFENIGHESEARYARLSFDTHPSTMLQLLQGAWKLRAPKLIITIHGGLSNFEMHVKMARAFRRGIFKSTQASDTWIITTGVHCGVVQHICDAITDVRSSRMTRSRVAAIGIAPWGLIKKRERLVGKNATVKYTTNMLSYGRFLELDNSHSHFLLADNGTVGRYGGEVILRRRLESFLATGASPVIAVVVEGGCFAVNVVHDYLHRSPSIPVVVCEGTGRASDVLAFAQKRLIEEEGVLSADTRRQLHAALKETFDVDAVETERLLRLVVESAQKKELLSVFRHSEAMQDVDHTIFHALMRGTNLDRLKLALAWNRVDIAKSEIFGGNLAWNQLEVQEALMYSLLHNRVDFVSLILETGVPMQCFLTFDRLEQLYNSEMGPTHTLHSLTKSEHLTIPMIGAVVERLMGRSFRSHYTSEEFAQKYAVYQSRAIFRQPMSKKRSSASREDRLSETMSRSGGTMNRQWSLVTGFIDDEDDDPTTTEMLFTFERPFDELLVWAVLTMRPDMALVMLKHGEEPMAKALVANRLFSSLARNASDEYLEMTVCDELKENASRFQMFASELLETCYQADDEMTASLLTYELSNWGRLTALTIAAYNHDRLFMKHPSCQALLNEIWHGGMVVKHSADWMVVASILIPPLLLTLDYKSKEELRKQPRTTVEFEERVDSSSDSSSSDSDSSFSDDDSTSSEEEKHIGRSNSSFTNLFQAARRSLRKRDGEDRTIQQLAAHTLPGMLPATAAGPLPGSTAGSARKRSDTARLNTRTRSESNSTGSRYTQKVHRVPSSSRHSRRRPTDDSCSSIFLTADDDGEREPNKTPLTCKQRVFEFYTAPITIFHMWEMGFALFQIVLAYCILIRTDPEYVHAEEWYLFAYVVVFGCELLRKFLYYDVHPFSLKCVKFGCSFRNGSSIAAVLFHCIGFGFRCTPGWLMTGRVIMIMNSVLWSITLIEYLSVYRLIGPFVNTCSEMIPTCIPMLVLLCVILLSFGTVRQSITYPNEEWDMMLVRNIFFQPYWMLYGEVFAEEIDTCNDGMWNYHLDQGIPMYAINDTSDPEWNCVPGHWVAPLYMTFFMIISFVLLINSMIAACTWVYEHCILYTKETFLLERFRVVMDYESRPFLPPPLALLSHAYHIVKYVIWKCTGRRRHHRFIDTTLKSFLSPDQLHALHRFERQALDDMQRKKEYEKKNTEDERVVQSCNNSEQILTQLNTMSSAKETVREMIRELDSRLAKLESGWHEQLASLASLSIRLDALAAAADWPPPPHEEAAKKLAQRGAPPRACVDEASEETNPERESECQTSDVEERLERRSSSSGRAPRQRAYTSIADGIERAASCSRPSQYTRRRRHESSSGDLSLHSVSEVEEF